MSSYDNEDSPALIQGIKLIRLRDRALGFEKGEQFIDPLLKEVLEVLAEIINKADTTPDTANFIVSSMIHSISRYTDEVLPYQISELRKSISSLNILTRNTGEENSQLRAIESKLEGIMQEMRNIEIAWENSHHNLDYSIIGRMKDTMNNLVNVHSEFTELRNKINERTRDALAVISNTIDPIKAEQLFRLFWAEP